MQVADILDYFCASFELPSSLACYSGFLWTIGVVAVACSALLVVSVKLLRRRIIQKSSFCANFTKILMKRSRNTICQYVSDSQSINSLTYYSILTISLLSGSLPDILNFVLLKYFSPDFPEKTSKPIEKYLLAFSADLLRSTRLFIWFFVIEVISWRSKYFPRTLRDDCCPTIRIAERQIAIRFILKRSFVFSFILFLFLHISSVLLYQDLLQTSFKEPTLFLYSLLVHGVILLKVIPTLRIMNYENNTHAHSKQIAREVHVQKLLIRHLQEQKLDSKGISNLVTEIEAAMRKSLQNEVTPCGYTAIIEEKIEQRITISYSCFLMKREIALKADAAMLSHPKSSVFTLKFILIWLLISNLWQEYYYIRYFFGLTMAPDNADPYHSVCGWIQAINDLLDLSILAVFMFLLLRDKLSFGEQSRSMLQQEREFLGRSLGNRSFHGSYISQKLESDESVLELA